MKDDEPEAQRSWVTLAAVIGGIALLVWLVFAFVDWNKMQACITEGRRDCDRITQH